MHRSPVIFWLLLAATICVDAMAIAWMFEGITQPRAAVLFIAMAYAQVSVLCAWAVLNRPAGWIRWLIPFGVGFVVALIIAASDMRQRASQNVSWEQLLAFASLMWVHIATLLLLLWLLKPTRLFVNYQESTNYRSWQFTTKHLLFLMTCLPILVIAFKKSAIVRAGVTANGFWEFVAWVFGNVVLTLAIAAIVQRKWMWVLRLAAGAGAALIAGIFMQWTVPELSRSFPTIVFSLIQAIVIWLWLEQMRPAPPPALVSAADAPLPE